jgi:hypothetical protein
VELTEREIADLRLLAEKPRAISGSKRRDHLDRLVDDGMVMTTSIGIDSILFEITWRVARSLPDRKPKAASAGGTSSEVGGGIGTHIAQSLRRWGSRGMYPELPSFRKGSHPWLVVLQKGTMSDAPAGCVLPSLVLTTASFLLPA